MFLNEGGELLVAAVPSPHFVHQLFAQLDLREDAHGICLAYSGTCGLKLVGFLVCDKGNLDAVLAFCPIHGDLQVASPMWRREVSRQLAIAVRIASCPEENRGSPDAIWFGTSDASNKSIPAWVYALACVPINKTWTGDLAYPRPFCPVLFEALAQQPEAPGWMTEQLRGVAERASSGNSEGAAST